MRVLSVRKIIIDPALSLHGARNRTRTAVMTALALLAAVPTSAVPRGKKAPRTTVSTSVARPLLAEKALSNDVVERPPGCFIPGDTLSYHGGDLVAHPQVFLLFWGNEWATDALHQAAAAKVISFYQEVGGTGYACSWNEYSRAGNTIGDSSYAGSFTITTEPTSPLKDADIQQEIVNQIALGHAPSLNDDQIYVVLPPQGVPVDAGGETGCGGSNFVFCGYHDSFLRPIDSARVRYIVLPFPCSQGNGSCFFVPSSNPGDSLQVVASHEIGELVTDPDGPPVAAGGWFSDRTGNENGDICAPCNGTITAGSDTLNINPLWSNLARGCVDSVPCAAPTPECTDPTPGMCTVGHSPTLGCALEWLVYPNMTLQVSGLPGGTVTCTDGQPFCDVDNTQNDQCTFQVAACLNNADPRLSCNQAPIDAIQLISPLPTSANMTNSGNAARILTALSSIPGMPSTVTRAKVSYSPPVNAAANACTNYFTVVVPVRTVGTRKLAGTAVISPMAVTGSGRATDRLVLTCKPSPP